MLDILHVHHSLLLGSQVWIGVARTGRQSLPSTHVSHGIAILLLHHHHLVVVLLVYILGLPLLVVTITLVIGEVSICSLAMCGGWILLILAGRGVRFFPVHDLRE